MVRSEKHKYLKFSDNPKAGSTSYVGFYLVDKFLSPKLRQSRKKWKSDRKEYIIDWHFDGGGQEESKPLSYLLFTKYIRENGKFDTRNFNLPSASCFWMDGLFSIGMDYHRLDTSPDGLMMIDSTPQEQFGENYPIEPSIDREGVIYSSFNNNLYERIIAERIKLVETSDEFSLDGKWVFELRGVIGDVISLVEITLNQFYIKAQYDPLDGWYFDKDIVGEKHGRRFNDKLKWVYQITGNHINVEKYIENFNFLRKLRNHFTHFDPPSLAITIEEMALWLNYVVEAGYILIQLRKAMGAEISERELNFILQKEIEFVPKKEYTKRLPLYHRNTNYKSTEWKESE